MDDRSVPPSEGAPTPGDAANEPMIPDDWYRQAPPAAAAHGAALPPQPPGAVGGRPPRRRRRGLLVAGLAGVLALVLAGGAAAWYVLTRPQPEEAVDAYVRAWNDEDHAAMAALSTDADALADAFETLTENLGVSDVAASTGEVRSDGDTATTSYSVTLTLGELGAWDYEGELPLERVDGEWLVSYSPAVVHPELGEGQTLTLATQWEERGQILAADGTRLDTDEASGSIQMLTGAVRPAEEDDLEDLGPGYAEGDPIGTGGIQAAFQDQLAGVPTTQILRVDADAADDEAAEDEDEDTEAEENEEESDDVVGSFDGEPGEDVHTTIDLTVQDAAAQAIGGQDEPTALVAVRPSDGEVLAAVNVPGEFNRALDGQYPPGSSFKIISYEALLTAGMGMDATMDCPETAEVGGWDFRNAGDAEYGEQSVEDAFATSCNTALVQEVESYLDSPSLVTEAEEFGFNSDLNIGIPTRTPEFPAPDSTTLLAAMSIGQGQMLTSPLHMATVPAAVADGQWRSPVLISDPEVPDQPEPTPLAHAEELRTMMRAVVTDGTAEDAGFSGDVYGKTGSAEYGVAEDEDDELESHAWFVGYDADLDVAFAVVVEGGGSGSQAAAPLAASFLENL